jgi:predicted membrane-bound spermidine synthase
MIPSPYRARFWLLAIFVLSGFAGLIYQSIWSHYLGLFLGHAAYAQALVLAIFMGGMAAGAAWIAKAGQKWRNLIRGYAVIEVVIGVLGLLFHRLFTGVAELSYDHLFPALGQASAINLARWLVAALLILPQTILLGMTFPLMSGGLIRRFPGNDGHVLGGLYFTNSIGAAIGALAAVFVLLPWVGLPGAMVAAAALNFVVAGLAWRLARDPEPEKPADFSAHAEQRVSHNPLLRMVLFGTALSGAASFIYEIVWIRMLSMAVGSTMHSFELMLASFIAGLAFGGLWVRKHASKTSLPLRLAGWMQIFMGIAALGSLAVYANAFSWVGWIVGALTKTDAGYALFNVGTAVIAILIMLPAAFFAGTTLPLFTIALLQKNYGERSIGRVYAWNTLGAILGVFLAIHLLIPNIGLKLSLCVAAMIDLAVGLVLIRMHAKDSARIMPFAIAAVGSLLAIFLAFRVPFDPMQLASGVFRHGRSSLNQSSEVIYYKDGKTASVSVSHAKPGVLTIATNGKPDAAIMVAPGHAPAADEPTMALLAALPLSMHASPQQVGVIGFGSGLTTHTLLGDHRVKQVDTIEIEEAMVQGATRYGPRVARAFSDPRSNIIIDDAKTYFAGQNHKYDIIISEPSNPWISGVGALFSSEFYKFIPRHISEGGLFVQWIQLYEIDEALIGSILKAMAPAFEDYGAWMSNSTDLIIVASPTGKLPKEDLGKILSNGPLTAELARQGMIKSEHMRFRKIADARMLNAFTRAYATLPVNSDYHPVLGLMAPKTRFKGVFAEDLLSIPYQSTLFLEALGIRQPFPQSMEPSKLEHFPAELNTWRARALLSEFNGGGSDIGSHIVGRRALAPAILLKEAANQCNNKTASYAQRFSVLLREFHELTVSYLPAEMLREFWSNPVWGKCEDMPHGIPDAIKLLTSISARDYLKMSENGRKWLSKNSDEEEIRRIFDDIALSAVYLSHAHYQEWGEIAQIETTIGKNFSSKGDYERQRNLLNAMASEMIQK